jgi:hypothetical protein
VPDVITTLVTTGLVVSGTASKYFHITITNTGAIVPSTNYSVALSGHYAAVSNYGSIIGAGGAEGVSLLTASLVNQASGIISGGTGATNEPGGSGAVFTLGSLLNFGTIVGGSGGVPTMDYGTGGGTGVNLGPLSRITNEGFIGGGGVSSPSSSEGGIGLNLGYDDFVRNDGTIFGGSGGGNFYSSSYGPPIGVDAAYGSGGNTIANSGLIHGGSSAYGGAGILIGASNTVTNTGTIVGGSSGVSVNSYGAYVLATGGSGVEALGISTISTSGSIFGGAGGGGSGFEGSFNYTGGEGGAGISLLNGSHLTNHGFLEGGTGGVAYLGGAGGVGLYLYASTCSNSGTIVGGVGGTSVYQGGVGGVGVSLSGESSLLNSGLIGGGNGGYTSANTTAPVLGEGGTGVNVLNTAVVTNAGTIIGGAGGSVAASSYYGGGVGGAGAFIAGGTLINQGIVEGGTGGMAGAGTESGGAGGCGVVLASGTLVTSGLIEGGPGSNSGVAPGQSGDAVYFAGSYGNTPSYTATLVVDPGAAFVGTVQASVYSDDIFQLSGTSVGTLASIGSQFSGFTTLEVVALAHWTVSSGSLMPATAESLQIDSNATIAFSGSISSNVIFSGAGGGALTASSVAGPISGFGAGDQIGLTNTAANGLTFSSGTLDLTYNGVVKAYLDFEGDYSLSNFSVSENSHGSALVDFVPSGLVIHSWPIGLPIGFAGHLLEFGSVGESCEASPKWLLSSQHFLGPNPVIS